MKTLMTEDGNLTIPQALRERMGLSSQTVLNLYEENGRLIIDKAVEDDPVSRARGCIDLGMSTDEFINLLRGEP